MNERSVVPVGMRSSDSNDRLDPSEAVPAQSADGSTRPSEVGCIDSVCVRIDANVWAGIVSLAFDVSSTCNGCAERLADKVIACELEREKDAWVKGA
jgi:hypothetical protein